MKKCPDCTLHYRQNFTECPLCKCELEQSTFEAALKETGNGAASPYMDDQGKLIYTDGTKQYNIRSYLKNRSLFLDFDLYKNRLKYGNNQKRFFISPVNMTTIINLPWFLFNLISSNIFHLLHTEFCSRCNCRHILGKHSNSDCDYNIEYFHILNDINSGRIFERKHIYEINAREKRSYGLRAAYDDLFNRKVIFEAFWDLLSILGSVLFWLYIAVYVSFPMSQVLLQKLEYYDKHEWVFFVALR